MVTGIILADWEYRIVEYPINLPAEIEEWRIATTIKIIRIVTDIMEMGVAMVPGE